MSTIKVDTIYAADGVNGPSIYGNNTGDTAGAGLVGQVLRTGSIGSAVNCTNSSYSAIGSLNILKGRWTVHANANYSGAAGNSYFVAKLNLAAGSDTGTTYGIDAAISIVGSGNGVGGSISFSRELELNTSTTYYLNCITSSSAAGAGGILGSIIAIRR
jgi:hypothetical protein